MNVHLMHAIVAASLRRGERQGVHVRNLRRQNGSDDCHQRNDKRFFLLYPPSSSSLRRFSSLKITSILKATIPPKMPIT